MKNKFVILVTSYNDEAWVEYNIASILNQTYSNYKVLYYDDASTDNTYKVVSEITQDNNKFIINTRKKNMQALFSTEECIKQIKEDEILICLSGDDWLFDDNVLENLNNYYNKNNYWMTYGGFVCWDGSEDVKLPNPQSTPHSDFIHDYSLYRKDHWRASHLRTFRGSLLKKVDLSEFKSNINNSYYDHAADLALTYPCLEMCGKDKIGVLDFYSYVYNMTPDAAQRTQNREGNTNNHKFESEIRNRKVYKRLKDINDTPQKLPQIYTPSGASALASVPKKFTYCHSQTDVEFDMVLLNDGEISEYLDGKLRVYKDVPIVARLHEQRDYFQSKLANKVKDNHQQFHTILTYDKILLDTLPNAKFCNAEGITAFSIFPNVMNIPSFHPKITGKFDVSKTIKIFPKDNFNRAVCITSAKAFLPGHNVRLNFIRNSKDKIDLYGKGIKEVESKLDVLHNYAFALAIENNVSKNDYYFTEKLIECFITGTIPIYYGCPNIDKFFDTRGILTFNTQNELDDILDNLNEEKYNSMLKYAKANYEKAKKEFVLDNDSLYELHLKDIINNGTTI
tara:strand:- start:6478 stop:8175 length:1698 start_codon:yes stop_codon:yes gene_type:complete